MHDLPKHALHITNGDSTVSLIDAAGIEGRAVPWRDVLHDGPLRGDLRLEEMSRVRAHFLAGLGWASLEETLAEFAARDEALARFRQWDEVVLWFEHDLYDQLQLAQILHWFADQDGDVDNVFLVCIGRFPGLEPFYGLGQLSPDQFKTLPHRRQPVTDAQLRLARDTWHTLGGTRPPDVEALLHTDMSALEFLSSAIRRHLEQLPSTGNGLNRTERQILTAVADGGPVAAAALFTRNTRAEERPFLGDWSFFRHVRQLATGRRPLLAVSADVPETHEGFARIQVSLTPDGQEVLDGHADQIELNGIDCWWGGLHQVDPQTTWRWDGRSVRQ